MWMGAFSVYLGRPFLQPGSGMDQTLFRDGKAGCGGNLTQGHSQRAPPELSGEPFFLSFRGFRLEEKRALSKLPYQLFPFSQKRRVGISMCFNADAPPFRL